MEDNAKAQEEALKKFLDTIKNSVEGLASDTLGITKEEMKDVENAVISGAPLYQILGMKESMLEARYALANQLYTASKYDDAEALFKWLCGYDNTNPTYWLGLGACRQALGKYTEAIEAYQMAAINSSLEDPAPFYYSAICLLKQGQKEEAKVAMEAVIVLGDENRPEHKGFITKAKTIIDGLKGV